MKTTFRFKVPMQLFAFITLILPLVVIPIIAYLFDNWWLLCGVLSVFLGVWLAESKPKLFFVLPPLGIAFWIEQGFDIHNPLTFFLFCCAFGYVFYSITIEYEKLFKKELVSNV